MHELTLEVKERDTVELLRLLAKKLNFSIRQVRPATALSEPNSILQSAIVPGDPSVSLDGMEEIYTNAKLDAKTLRQQAWQRNK